VGLIFLINGAYAVALALLLLSWRLHEAPVRWFVGESYTLGSHGQVWKDWHTVGCAFVGAINLAAWGAGFNEPALRSVAACTAGVFGVWALQNLALVASPSAPPFTPRMWLHVVACGAASALAAYTAVML